MGRVVGVGGVRRTGEVAVGGLQARRSQRAAGVCGDRRLRLDGLGGPADVGQRDVILRRLGAGERNRVQRVAAYIRRSLDAAGLKAFDEKGPRTVAAANLVHLRSDFFVELASGDKALLGDLLDRLNPTSAVLGMPKQPALDFLTAHEGYDRDYYTGFLGPVGFDGGTDLYVNLRTSQIIGDTAYLYVGGGIVAQSQPDVEWEETVQKTKTVGTILNAGTGRHAPVAARG